MSEPTYDINDLIYLMQRLRDPQDGCPWDLEQSYQTIVPSTIEEAYEVADAIEQGDIASLREELGDLLFQTVFYSQLAAEEGRFTLSEVISDLVEKLVRRHPHVFPDGTLQSRKGDNLDSSGAVLQQWEDIKSGERDEKGHTSILDDVPRGFPALLRAQKLQKRAARTGFDWNEAAEVFDKLEEEIAEIKQAVLTGSRDQTEEELGDLLFTCVNLVRKMGHDSETALRRSNRKFEQRFRVMETEAGAEKLKTMTAAELEDLWEQAKKLLANGAGQQ